MRFEHIRLIPTRTGLRLKDRDIVTGVGSGVSKEIAFAFVRAAARYSLGRPVPLRPQTGHSMSKLLTVLATLKAILFVATITFATGDSLLVILISLLFNLAQLGAKLIGQTVPRDTALFSAKHDPAGNFRAAADSERGQPIL